MGRGEKATLKRPSGRMKKSYGVDDEDDDEYVAEEDESYESGTPDEESLDASDANNTANSASSAEKRRKAKVKSRTSYSSARPRSRFSDNEWEDDDYVVDEELSSDANEEEDSEEDSLFSSDISVSAKRGTAKRGGTKRKRKVSKSKVNRRSRKAVVAPGKRKRRRLTASSDDEDNGRSAMKIHRKNPKKVNKRMGKSRSTKKNRSSINRSSFDSDFLATDDDRPAVFRGVRNISRNKKKSNSGRRRRILKKDSETSDSDFEISEEDLLDNDYIELDRPGKSSRDEWKNASTSRKQPSVGSKCIGFDDGISDDEVNDLKIDRALNLQKHGGLSAEKKGKEIEDDDLGKQPCGICLSEEHSGTIQGILNCCSHYFCFACIMEWSKVESRCPLCKRRFVTITKYSRSGPMLEMRRQVIRVQMRDQVYQPSEEEVRVLLDPYEDVICMECHLGGDDSLMLLCDICDSSAHTYCVGLRNEVPEGNWYCDCCKLAGERSLHSQVLDTREANRGVEEENGSNTQNNSIVQRSVSLQGQSSSQVFDLNAPPRNFVEDSSVSASQVPGAGASTLSGRRAIHQRIRILLSNNRARQLYPEPNRSDIALHTEADLSVLEQNGERSHASERPNSRHSFLSNEHEQGNSRDFPHSDSNLVQQPIKRRNFRHVNGAKNQVQSLVKHCLQKLPREIPLERSAFKRIARKVTHTILASCEIHYSTSVVSSPVEPPDKCAHDLDGGPVNLLQGCCSACFADYVEYVVKKFVESS